MSEVSAGFLFIILMVLIILSGFFSGSETGLMAINRYRLRHLAKSGHKGALRVSRLLSRPDRLIGLILLANNFLNILASSLATVLALRLLGEAGIAVAALLLTLVLLVFGEVTPKTLAALHPERFAFPASLVLTPLLKLFYPLVWAINAIANLLLKPFAVNNQNADQHALSPAELRTVVIESASMIPSRHRSMLLSILDLEAGTVDDVMVPRAEVEGIDLNEDWESIMNALKRSQYTRLLVFRERIDHVVGILHVRSLIHIVDQDAVRGREVLEQLTQEPYFIPEGTALTTQLLNFQRQRERIGLVVDEYGDFQGLVALEDILEEIVGEFTTDPLALSRKQIVAQDDGYLVDGSTSVRLLNRTLNWDLPTDGPKTVNGLIMEYLETIPEQGTGLLLSNHPVEIVKISGNRVKTALMKPALEQKPDEGKQ